MYVYEAFLGCSTKTILTKRKRQCNKFLIENYYVCICISDTHTHIQIHNYEREISNTC